MDSGPGALQDLAPGVQQGMPGRVVRVFEGAPTPGKREPRLEGLAETVVVLWRLEGGWVCGGQGSASGGQGSAAADHVAEVK